MNLKYAVTSLMALNISFSEAQTAPNVAKNEEIGAVASSCEAVLAVSAVHLPKIFTAQRVDPAMVKFADIGAKAIGSNNYSHLSTKKTADTSYALGFIKNADPAGFAQAVQKNADGANRCLALLLSGWPHQQPK